MEGKLAGNAGFTPSEGHSGAKTEQNRDEMPGKPITTPAESVPGTGCPEGESREKITLFLRHMQGMWGDGGRECTEELLKGMSEAAEAIRWRIGCLQENLEREEKREWETHQE